MFESGSNRTEIVREKNGYRIVAPIQTRADRQQVEELLDALRRARSAGFIVDEPREPSVYGIDPPAARIEVETSAGKQALRIGDARQEKALTEAELAAAMQGFGSQRGMTFARLRKLIGLPDSEAFRDVPRDEEGGRDVVNRSAGNGCMQGSATLRAAIGEHNWKTLLQRPEKLDEIAFIITFRATPESIEKGLFEAGLDPDMLHAIMAAVEKGAFASFTGAGHVSAKACRAIIPGLQRGLVYSEACAAAGYDHAARPVTEIASINNPVARRALGEALKQVKAIIAVHGKPDRIHIEMARDVGKSKEERDKITSGLDKRNKERDKLRASFAETVGGEPSGAEDMLRFELWTEQKYL